MILPKETQARVISKPAKEPRNGEFYVSFGHGCWYSNALNSLDLGSRI
ncbi:hypothetical protein SAMN05216262_106119 [Colwellia chukchiensis]|uniref:Uncharacterized protein n=1 Tax=Colwellia chukchiensis TaxID=641665 RepID=A0A1H7MSC4_9GAMM|nr:hypothetical protein SAMN05216262_106119 [Colwellia chukchiensis]